MASSFRITTVVTALALASATPVFAQQHKGTLSPTEKDALEAAELNAMNAEIPLIIAIQIGQTISPNDPLYRRFIAADKVLYQNKNLGFLPAAKKGGADAALENANADYRDLGGLKQKQLLRGFLADLMFRRDNLVTTQRPSSVWIRPGFQLQPPPPGAPKSQPRAPVPPPVRYNRAVLEDPPVIGAPASPGNAGVGGE